MSNYFSYFSKSKYQFSKTETKNAVDILKRVGLSETLLNDDRNVQSIFVKDGQTPETIAEIAYGDSDFYWVVLLSAKIHNPYYGWPLEYQQLESRLDKEYPGVSLFVSSLPSVASSAVKGVGTKSAAINFSNGDVIQVLDSEENIKITGTIYEYDLTSGHMKIKITSGNSSFSYDTSNDFIVKSTTDTSKTGYLRRKINFPRFSLNSFKDTVTGREYSPLYLLNDIPLIEIYTDTTDTPLSEIGTLSSGTTILNAGIEIVTVEDIEQQMNDRNRYVKILKPSFLRKLTSEMKFNLRD